MKLKGFKKIISNLDKLSPLQFNFLKISIENTNTPNKIFSLLETPICDVSCPYCFSDSFYKWGVQNKLQRYKCKSCNRTYNSLSGTYLSNLSFRYKWLQFSDCLVKGYSIRKTAIICSISNSTSFKWRHRFLQASKHRKIIPLRGIVEADDTYLLENFKGSRNLPRPSRHRAGKIDFSGNSKGHVGILVCRNRNDNTFNFSFRVLCNRTMSLKLKKILASDSLFCTDKKSAYLNFSKNNNLRHGYIDVNQGVLENKSIIHLKNVNHYHYSLKEWMTRFNGVASKYLDNYLAWFRVLESTKMSISAIVMLNISKERIIC